MPEMSLRRHPSTPCAFIRAVSARVDWLSDERLVFCYRLEGNIDALQLPAQQRPARADGLWKRTCFEAFIKPPGAGGYFEFNFSPSNEWAVYHFDEYRQGMKVIEPAHPPGIICQRREGELDAGVEVHPGALNLAASGALQVAVAAVLQDHTGAMSCWALAHPEGQPDFHHPAGFTLALPRAAGAG